MKNVNLYFFSLVVITLFSSTPAFSQRIFHGVIYDQDTGRGLSDVSIRSVNDGRGTVSDSLGRFVLHLSREAITLNFSKLGYRPRTEEYRVSDIPISMFLQANPLNIEEVEINTGYQRIPRERA